MRTIEKGSEPPCLAALRREARRIEAETGHEPEGDDWNPGDCADGIRSALHSDQAGLCAYCMQRIQPHGYRSNLASNGGMKIEHWLTRTGHPRAMYDWPNLLGVCGGEFRGADGLVEHCDTARKEGSLTVHPASPTPPRPERAFVFTSSPPPSPTEITTTGLWLHARHADDTGAAHDIVVLNLNAPHLAANRHRAIEGLRLKLRKAKTEADLRKVLRDTLATATRPGPNGLPAFAPLVADFVQKKMQAKGMPR